MFLLFNVSISALHTLGKAFLSVLELFAAGRQPLQVGTRRVAKNLPEMIGKMTLIEEARVQQPPLQS